MEKKRFQTQKANRWQLADRLSWLIPIALFAYVLFGSGVGRWFWMDETSNFDALSLVSMIIFFILVTAILSVPPMLIWRAVTRTMKNRALKNATYYAHEGMDYYREKLGNLSPTTISILMDLEIETKKDVTALILKYSTMGVVSMQQDHIAVVNLQHEALKESDHILLQMIASGRVTQEGLAQWKSRVIEEELTAGYIEDTLQVDSRNTKVGPPIGCLMGGCLIPFVLVFSIVFVSVSILDMDGISQFLDAAPEGLSASGEAVYLTSDPQMMLQLSMLLVLSIVLFVALVLPVATLIARVVSAGGKKWIRRSSEGELLVEKIAGMKAFIHDFSNLSQAEKEALVVWDDFLIYAIVLEENQDIVDDIFSMRNFDLRRYQIIN